LSSNPPAAIRSREKRKRRYVGEESPTSMPEGEAASAQTLVKKGGRSTVFLV
jgi:hypothetical protein